MKTLFTTLLLLACSLAVFAESKEFTVSSSADDCIAQGVSVKFSYTLPSDDPLVAASKNDPAMKPAVAIWYWGDDEPGAKTKSYTQVAWVEGQTVSHVYKKRGRYGINLLVNDTKNRNIRQTGLKIEIRPPVEVESR